jgi:hypothetical protein
MFAGDDPSPRRQGGRPFHRLRARLKWELSRLPNRFARLKAPLFASMPHKNF